MKQLPYRICVVCTVGGIFMVGCGDAGDTGIFGNATSSSSGTAGAGGEAGAGGDAGKGGAGGTAGAGGGGPCVDGETQSCFTGDPNTLGVGVCVAGTQTCAKGMFGPCTGEVTATVEHCNGLDEDCNGIIDDGCQCVNGTTQPCYGGPAGTENMGQCTAGTQTCANGMWGNCMGDVTPAMETCDGLDNDCNGQADDGNPGGGTACTTNMPGVCQMGTTACTAGMIVCNQNTMASAETCDGIDNDCNGMIDDGATGVGMPCDTGQFGICAAGTMTCTNGMLACTPDRMATAEACDGLDNDCDGLIDDGNPGGGVACGPSLGACTTQTACVNGAVVCRGTFVGPMGVGAPNNPGTQAMPVSTIAAAQANAAIIGGGADVCVCDTAPVGASIYNEDVTMIEGISVLGGYNCADWSRAIATSVTTIQNTGATGVKFPAGITSVTALDGMTVTGLGGNNVMVSAAITVTNSSPSLLTVTATGGQAPTSYGLNVAANNGGTASPTVTGGAYSASATGNNSTQIGVNLTSASGTFTNVAMTGSPASGTTAATTSVGLRCSDCAGTTISGGSMNGSGAATTAAGLWASGNVAGLSVTMTTISGGQVLQAAGTAYGVRLETCNGSPTFTTANILGGTGANGSRFGVESTGMMCTPTISGGLVRGCESGANCTGISCSTSSACTATNATIRGASATASATSYGVRCATSGCGKFTGNTITVGNVGNNATAAMGIDIVGANPAFDDNEILGPMCPNGVMGTPALYAAHFSNTTSLVTNNVIRDQQCLGAVDAVRFDKAAAAVGVLGPTIHSNTVLFTTCNNCGNKRGLVITAPPGATVAAAGIVRNNIFRNVGTANPTAAIAVREMDTSSDLLFFENNDLFTPNGGILYVDEGTTPLLLPAINLLMGSAANISVNPQLDATFHLLAASPCRNAGTATGAPALDFDGNMRPQEMSYDIGADEYVP